MSDKMPKMVADILARLASGPVRIQCFRAKKLAKDLQKELQMCEVKLVREDRITQRHPLTRRTYRSPGELLVTWKAV